MGSSAGEQSEPRPPSQSDIMARLSNLVATPPRMPAQQPESQPQRAAPVAERAADPRGRPNMFDALWPAEVRASRQSQPEAIARAPKVEMRPEPEPRAEPKFEPRAEARPEPRIEPRPEPKLDLKPEVKPSLAPRFEPPPMSRERTEPPVNVAPREPMAPPAAEPRPIAILKSGVIDGMAYTLYTDGSIEAELPQGMMRFSSIDELRAHLEQAERPQ
jgi:hypothetical protein